MIARVGFFEDFDFTDREYVVETIRGLPGFRGVLHLVDPESGDAISISLWDSQEDASQAQAAVGTASRDGGHAGPGPSRVQAFQVVHAVLG